MIERVFRSLSWPEQIKSDIQNASKALDVQKVQFLGNLDREKEEFLDNMKREGNMKSVHENIYFILFMFTCFSGFLLSLKLPPRLWTFRRFSSWLSLLAFLLVLGNTSEDDLQDRVR